MTERTHFTSAFTCHDCGVDTAATAEYYMLQHELWSCAFPENEGMLCVGCCEMRLGRQLTSADFLDCPLNNDPRFIKSERLSSRMAA